MTPSVIASSRTPQTGLLRASLVVALFCTLLPSLARADKAGAGSDKPGELYSIEKRDLMGSHEISVMIGTLPKDAFETGLTLQGSYTYHFTHLLAWEIIGGTYSFNLATPLETELSNRFDVKPERGRGVLEALVHSNFVFKPLYGKLALLNDRLLTAEMFFVIGPALGFFDDQSRPFGVDVGVGLRFFLGRYFSLRLDIRNYAFLPEFKEVDNHLYLSFGLSLTFGFSKDASEEE